MKNPEIIIIGRGLIGGMIARYFMYHDISVVVIDNTESESASKCSAGIWNDSWTAKVQEEANVTVEVMNELKIPIQEIDFYDKEERENKTRFFHVNPFDIILEKDFIDDKVWEVKDRTVMTKSNGTITAKRAVIIAAGVWTDELLIQSGYKKLGVDRFWGEAFYYAGERLDKSYLWSWAPYRQAYAFNYKENRLCDECSFSQVCNHKTDAGRAGGIYFANSTTVKNPKESGDIRIEKAETRLFEHALSIGLKPKKITSILTGFRPFLPNDVSLINKHDKGLYSATGGRKHSTILSGWIAKELFKKIMK